MLSIASFLFFPSCSSIAYSYSFTFIFDEKKSKSTNLFCFFILDHLKPNTANTMQQEEAKKSAVD